MCIPKIPAQTPCVSRHVAELHAPLDRGQHAGHVLLAVAATDERVQHRLPDGLQCDGRRQAEGRVRAGRELWG